MLNNINEYELPHIVALHDRLVRAREALDLPEKHTRRQPLCPLQAAEYDEAHRAYFAAVDEARAEIKVIENSIALALRP